MSGHENYRLGQARARKIFKEADLPAVYADIAAHDELIERHDMTEGGIYTEENLACMRDHLDGMRAFVDGQLKKARAAERFEDAVNELQIYAENTSGLYAARLKCVDRIRADMAVMLPIVNADGLYPTKYFRSWFEWAAVEYRREIGSSEYRFTERVIRECARRQAAEEHSALLNGEYD